MKRPSFKIVLHAKILKSGKRSVALRVTFNRASRFFFLGHYCTPEDWDADNGRLLKTFAGYRRANELLAMYEQRASDALFNLERDGIPFSFERFERAVFVADQSGGSMRFADWISHIEAELRAVGKPGNAHFYKEAARAIRQFRPASSLSDVDERYLRAFERWAAINRNLKPGGLLALLRNIRAACNRAVADGIMPAEWCPFPKYKLTHLKNRKAKKGAPLEFFRALEKIEPAALSEWQRLSLDLFLFSFYCRGINLADVAGLTDKNIQAGRLTYIRRKTGREYSMRLNEKAAAIVRKYQRGRGYLFPLYDGSEHTEADKEAARRRFDRRVNKALRAVAGMIGWEVEELSFYTARHSYADILKNAGVSVEVISQALGHSDIRVTDAYLKGFGDTVLDEADRFILN